MTEFQWSNFLGLIILVIVVIIIVLIMFTSFDLPEGTVDLQPLMSIKKIILL